MEIRILTTHFPPPTSTSGERGSNTCLTHPPVGHNSAKAGLIPDGPKKSKDFLGKLSTTKMVLRLEERGAADQLVGEVMAHQG
jgi:hypothetical protein